MDAPAGETHHRYARANQQSMQGEAMWQVHAAFRFGHYRTPEFDFTPALGATLIVAVIALIIHTGL
jgi:hypothetical protein